MATVPVEMTAVAGTVLLASQWNSNVRDALNFVLNRPVFEGRQTISQSLPNASSPPITLDTEDIDNDNGHSTSTNTSRYVAQTAGRWRASGAMSYSANATGRRAAILAINATSIVGGEVDHMAVTNGQPTVIPSRTRTVFLNAGDYLELWPYQDSTATLSSSVSVNTWHPTLSMIWEGTT